MSAKVSISSQVVMGVIELEVKFLGGRVEHLQGLLDDFGAGSVSTDDCDVVAFHEFFVSFYWIGSCADCGSAQRAFLTELPCQIGDVG